MFRPLLVLPLVLASALAAPPSNVLSTATTVSPVSSATPSSTILGLTPIATIVNDKCNVEGYTPPTSQTADKQSAAIFGTAMECMYGCMSQSQCGTYYWNPSTLECGRVTEPWTPQNGTGVFFSQKDAGCFSIIPPTNITSAPFAAEDGVWVNTAVGDCGIEGSFPGFETTATYTSILDCQALCDGEDGCIHYSWNTTATSNNCGYAYSWLAGPLVGGQTGVYYSEGRMKTGYNCFSDKPFTGLTG